MQTNSLPRPGCPPPSGAARDRRTNRLRGAPLHSQAPKEECQFPSRGPAFGQVSKPCHLPLGEVATACLNTQHRLVERGPTVEEVEQLFIPQRLRRFSPWRLSQTP